MNHGGLWLLAIVAQAGVALAHAGTPGDALRARIAAAQPGAIIEVASGTYDGPFVISTPLQLHAPDGATLEGTGRGHVVAINAFDVAISGFLIRRSGSDLSTDDSGIHVRGARARIHDNTIVDTLHGIYLLKAPGAVIARNVIRGRAAPATIADPMTDGLQLAGDELCSVELGQDQRGNGIHVWNCSDHRIEENDIRGTRDGIYFSFCNTTLVRRNRIQDVRYGLHYMYSDDNVFEGNHFTRNAAGSALMYSSGITLRANRFVANRSHRAYGLLLHTVENTRIEDNVIAGNTIGLFIENSLANVVTGNAVAANYIGVRLSDSSDDNLFTGNRLQANMHAVETSGLNASNRWADATSGNAWDNAVALDFNRDGVADVPHFEADLFGRWRRTLPEIGLLSGSPGERAVRFMHARLRLPGVPGVHDPRPLTP